MTLERLAFSLALLPSAGFECVAHMPSLSAEATRSDQVECPHFAEWGEKYGPTLAATLPTLPPAAALHMVQQAQHRDYHVNGGLTPT